MVTIIESLFSREEVDLFRQHLAKAHWLNGQETAGGIARQVKANQQLADDKEPAVSLGQHVLRQLAQHPTFISAALPDRIYPPKFNRYAAGGHYGAHIDGSLMQLPGSALSVRTDVSATLFLSNADEYDGGELVIHDRFGVQKIKLNAGDMVLYPSTSLHEVLPVSRGERVASFFWIQSMVRSAEHREMLYGLDQSVQSLTEALGANHEDVVALSGLYHNLMRGWAQT